MPQAEHGGDSFGDFVTAALPALLRFGHVLTGHPQEAEDLVQEALAKSMRRWCRGRPDEPLVYVRKVMVNTHVTRWRRWGSRVQLGDVPDAAAEDTGLQRSTDRDALRRALAALPPGQRAVLVLRYLENMAYDEIADLLGCRPATVRSQAMRGLAALRPLLGDPGPAFRGGNHQAGNGAAHANRAESGRGGCDVRGLAVVAHDLEAEQRLRELLTDPAWELPAWPDAADRVRAAARRQRQRSAGLAATAAAVCAVVVCAVVISTGLSALRLGHSAPGAAGQAYSLPTANAAGFPADVHPRTELGPLLRRGSRCPDPAGVLSLPANVRAETAAVVRHLGAGFESDLRSSDPSDWPAVLTSWRSGVAATARAAPVLYSGPLRPRPAAAWSAGLARAVRISCGARIAAGTWLVVTGQHGPSAPRSEYLLLDRRGHLLVWHTE